MVFLPNVEYLTASRRPVSVIQERLTDGLGTQARENPQHITMCTSTMQYDDDPAYVDWCPDCKLEIEDLHTPTSKKITQVPCERHR
jgi:hypothetical protein